MALDWYVGPWQWRNAPGPCWNPPPGFAGLDLRSLPDHAAGATGLGLFYGTNQPNPGSEYTLLGSGPPGSVTLAAKQAAAIPRRAGFTPAGTTLRAVILSLLTDGADPDGLDYARPILPTAQMTVELAAAGSVLAVPFVWGTGHTALVRQAIRADVLALLDRVGSDEARLTKVRRVLGALCRKYRLDYSQWTEFVPAARQADVPGPLDPQTTITESFDKADGANLGPDLAWTAVTGTWRTDSNRGGKSATGSVVEMCRADSDLSSADHYAQVVVVLNSAFGGPCCRCPSSSTMTFYVAFAGSPVYITKLVSGAQTNLTSGSGTTTNDTLQIRASGSTITARVNGTQVLSVTDTAITGNLRCGLHLFYATAGNFDAFQAADLAANYTSSPAGSCSAAGTLRAAVSKAAAGSTAAAGVLARTTAKPLAGSTKGVGTPARLTAKPLAGGAAAAGSLAKAAAKGAGGSTAAGGGVASSATKPLAGSTAAGGTVARATTKAAGGSSAPAGAVGTTRAVVRAVAGFLAATGATALAVLKALAGAVTGAGTLATVGGASGPPAGVVTLAGADRSRASLAGADGSAVTLAGADGSAATLAGADRSATTLTAAVT